MLDSGTLGRIWKRHDERRSASPVVGPGRATLRFADDEQERAFCADYARRTRIQTRVSQTLALAIYLVLGFQDPWFFPRDPGIILTIRLCVSATLLVSVIATWHPKFELVQQPWVLVQTLIAGAGVVLMIARADLVAANSYYVGLMLVIVWAFIFSGLRFYPALTVNLLLIAAYAGVFAGMSGAPARWILTDVSNCVAAAMIAGFAGYVIELHRRLLFGRNRALWRERDSHQRLALHDHLTGLPNRRQFLERLAEAMHPRERRKTGLAILFLDVDNFKPVNDAFGHFTGDQVLTLVATRLESCLRHGDLVARIGGDEFLILVDQVSDRADAEAFAKKMLHALTEPLDVARAGEKERCVRVSASIGIAMYPRDGHDADALIKAADAAMYAVKSDGRNGYRFYFSDDVDGRAQATARTITRA
jgi:diguanylate cyclase (GGDEF)-like protein